MHHNVAKRNSHNAILFCGRLPQRISKPTTNFWSTGRTKQELANQRWARQRQRPLGRLSLATADKDADHWALVSQWRQHLERTRHYRPLGRPPPALAALRLPNMENRRRSRSPARRGRSLPGIHQEFTWLNLQIPERTSHIGDPTKNWDYGQLTAWPLSARTTLPFTRDLSVPVFRFRGCRLMYTLGFSLSFSGFWGR